MTTVRANIYAVADRAGVSIATVSRVQRGIGPVSAETRERVLRAIEELRYTPNGSGRALATQRQGAMGIVFPDLSGPYYSEVILGVEGEMVAAGQSLLILGTHGREHRAELVLDLMSRVDGLIVMGRTVDDEVVRALEGGRAPMALLARPPVDDIPSVRAEGLAPGLELTQHLLGHGHERLAFVGDPASSPDAEERWRGFAQALGEDAGRAVRRRLRRGRGPPAAGAALDQGATALLCASDELALGAYGAARSRGLRIPEDIAITGWDDIQLARFVSPALTTVRQPMRELGAAAARLLFERIAGAEPGGARAGQRRGHPRELRLRAAQHRGGDQDEAHPEAAPALLIAALATWSHGMRRRRTRRRRGRPASAKAKGDDHRLGARRRGREAARAGAATSRRRTPASRSTSRRSRSTQAHDKILTSIAGSKTPDVAWVGRTWMGEFAKTGALDEAPELDRPGASSSRAPATR